MLCILKCTVLQLHVTQVFALILRGIPSEKSSLLLLLFVNCVGRKLCKTSLEANIWIYSYSLGARLKAAGSKNTIATQSKKSLIEGVPMTGPYGGAEPEQGQRAALGTYAPREVPDDRGVSYGICERAGFSPKCRAPWHSRVPLPERGLLRSRHQLTPDLRPGNLLTISSGPTDVRGKIG